MKNTSQRKCLSLAREKRVQKATSLLSKGVLSFRRQPKWLAAGGGRANGVNLFIRKAHGRHTEESPQRSATPSVGGSFAWRAGVQSGSDSQIRESAARKAQNAAQDSLHRQRQRLRARRAGSGQGAGEGRLGLVWRDLH